MRVKIYIFCYMRNQRENLKKEEGKELSPTFVLKKKKKKN